MSIEKSEVEFERVQGRDPYRALRLVLLGFAIVSIGVGLRHMLRGMYRFHVWDW